MADRHCFFALRDDAREERHDEELECLAHLLDVPAHPAGHAAYACRPGEFGTRLCAVVDWDMVRYLHGNRAGGLHLYIHSAARPFEGRAPSRVARKPRIQLSVQ